MKTQLWQAVHMLHQEAHGNIPFRTCTADPCRHLGVSELYPYHRKHVLNGPAPLSLPYGEQSH